MSNDMEIIGLNEFISSETEKMVEKILEDGGETPWSIKFLLIDAFRSALAVGYKKGYETALIESELKAMMDDA